MGAFVWQTTVIAILLILSECCHSKQDGDVGSVVQLQVMVSGEDSGADIEKHSHIEVEMVNDDLQGCIIENAVDQFQHYDAGALLVLETEKELGACYHFSGPVSELVVYYYNDNVLQPSRWTPEEFRVLISDSSFVDCYDGKTMENSTVHEVKCGKYKEEHGKDE